MEDAETEAQFGPTPDEKETGKPVSPTSTNTAAVLTRVVDTAATLATSDLVSTVYTADVTNGPPVHATLGVVLDNTAAVTASITVITIVLGLETSPTRHGQAKARRRQVADERQIPVSKSASPSGSTVDRNVAVSRPIYTTAAILNDEVVFIQVDATNILVGRPASTTEDAFVAITLATIASTTRPDGQDSAKYNKFGHESRPNNNIPFLIYCLLPRFCPLVRSSLSTSVAARKVRDRRSLYCGNPFPFTVISTTYSRRYLLLVGPYFFRGHASIILNKRF